MFVKSFAHHLEIWKSYSTSKVDPILKLSNHKGTTQIVFVFRTKAPNLHAVSWRNILIFYTRVLWVPADPITKGVCAFWPGTWDWKKRPSIWREKKNTVNGLTGGAHTTRLDSAKLQDLSPGVNIRFFMNLSRSSWTSLYSCTCGCHILSEDKTDLRTAKLYQKSTWWGYI